jgi:hypothetical protein
VNQGRDVALVIAPTSDTMVLQLQACVTEKNQTVMEFTLRTLKEIPCTGFTSLAQKTKSKLPQSFDTPVCTSIYQSTRRKNKEQQRLQVENIYFSSRREIILRRILYKNVM